jgi:hypothetical protein
VDAVRLETGVCSPRTLFENYLNVMTLAAKSFQMRFGMLEIPENLSVIESSVLRDVKVVLRGGRIV